MEFKVRFLVESGNSWKNPKIPAEILKDSYWNLEIILLESSEILDEILRLLI